MGVTTSTANAGATYTPIATTTLGSAQPSVTFSSISQGYTDLILVANTKFASNATTFGPTFTLNGDTGSNYSYTLMYGNGTTAGSIRQSRSRWASGGDSTNFEANILHFMNYANTTTYKTIIGRANAVGSDTSAFVNLWRGSTGSATQAITSITLYGPDGTVSIAAGTTFTLYGIRSA